VTEIYYPNTDRPQTRDLQYLFTDNESFFTRKTAILKHESNLSEADLATASAAQIQRTV